MTKTVFTFSLAISVALLFAIQARPAPGKTGQQLSLSVNITDPQGAVIPNAAVWLRSRPGTRIRVSITNEEGICAFSELANESYTVFAAFPGFMLAEIKEIRIAEQRMLTVVLRTQ